MSIEVILKQPVPKLGAEADILKVKSGYARNFLFPRGIALPATEASKRQIEEWQKQRAEREAQELNAAQELAGKLNKQTITFQMQASKGKMFGSVTAADIVGRLEEMGYEIEKKKLGLGQPIKTPGEHAIKINLGHSVSAELKIVLELPEGETVEEDAKAAKGKKKFSKKPRKSAKEE